MFPSEDARSSVVNRPKTGGYGPLILADLTQNFGRAFANLPSDAGPEH